MVCLRDREWVPIRLQKAHLAPSGYCVDIWAKLGLAFWVVPGVRGGSQMGPANIPVGPLLGYCVDSVRVNLVIKPTRLDSVLSVSY